MSSVVYFDGSFFGLLGFGDCGTNLLFVGECVRVVILIGCIWRSGLVMRGVWLQCGSLEKRFVFDTW